ncbi:MAG TPA: PP2C family protein-serine/threonine phosphatase [Tepidisphaeraceae bacterium]|jgi:serine phosphatase RsbU (regulator of sigma subunit)
MPDTPDALACMEIRGGNAPANVGMAAPGLSMHVISRPFREAAGGGDVHFVSTCGTGRITRLLVADVSGHGTHVDGVARVLHQLMFRYVNHIDARKFVEKMNDEFSRLTADNIFATAIVGTYFAPRRELSLINAGHPPPLLYRAATARWSLLEDAGNVTETNYPLGVIEQTSYEKIDVRLEADDALIFYTDALPESRDAVGELLGVERLIELANALPLRTSMSAWLDEYLATIATIAPGNLVGDDLTILLLRANGTSERARLSRQLTAAVRLLASPRRLAQAVPWPEWTLQNVGGAIFPWIGRR